MIEHEESDGVAVIRINHGVTNAINTALLEELARTLKNVEEDFNSVVLTGNQKFFSIGFKLPELLKLDRKGMETFYRLFNRTCLSLFSLPNPTVDSVGGHAIAGGCILALCCDYRYMSRDRKLIGLNEIKLGVPIPYLSFRLLLDLVGARVTREIEYTGDFYNPETAKQLGLVDDVFPPGELLSSSVEKARSLNALPEDAFRAHKKNRVERIRNHVIEVLDEKEDVFLECWFGKATRKSLEEAAEKF